MTDLAQRPKSARVRCSAAIRRAGALMVVFGCCLAQAAGQTLHDEDATERLLPMMADPPLHQPEPTIQFDRRNITLWLAAMRRPEFDVRMDAIESFAQAHRQGVTNLDDAIDPIESLLVSDPHPHVRLAAARALIEFDHKSSAGALLRAASNEVNPSSELVLAADIALVRWRYLAAVPNWISRLEKSKSHPAAAASAIRSLGAVGAAESADALSKAVRDQALSPAVRLEAARAMPLINAPERSKLAVELSSEGGPSDLGSLLALLTLGSDHVVAGSPPLDTAAVGVVDCLVRSADPRVCSRALSLLRRADLRLALSKPELLRAPDDQVRLEAVRALSDGSEAGTVTVLLAAALNDFSEPVRTSAAAGLRTSWKHDPAGVQDAIERALSAGRWREAEQAAMLAGELRIAVLAPKLESLLAFEREEVRLAACISLRQLNSKESVPALLARAEVLTAAAPESAKVPDRFNSESDELAQIFMTVAQQKYSGATSLLRKYIPKRSGFHPLARAAALYALGKIFESQPDSDLANQLLQRAEDNNPVNPEATEVRRFSIIALGRMKARGVLPALHDLYQGENSVVSVGGASRWAIMEIEAVNLPACSPVVKRAGPFFLEAASHASGAAEP